MKDVAGRSRYSGLLQIFRYNQPFYLRTVAGIGIVIAIALRAALPAAPRAILLLGAGASAFWTCSSLLVSHYVYDRSPLYSLCWLSACLAQPPRRWINLHSGIDELSGMIAELFPGSQGVVFDIYDAKTMTEPSIAQARRTLATLSAAADWRALPAPDEEFDAAFLFFTAHELRRHRDRAQFFREVARVLRRGGEAVVVEHVRDWANLFAFGPGFLHFFSQRTWERAAHAAHLSVERNGAITPFVRVLVLRRSR